jgi:hypothetical protein
VLPVAEHSLAVDEHMHHAGAVLVWLDERGVVLHGCGVEHHHVGVVALDQSAPAVYLEILGR